MKKQLTAVLLILLSAIMVLAGCGNNEEDTSKEAKKEEQQTADEAFPVTIKDATKKEVTIDKKPERIVSLIPSNTEITYAVGAGKQVVGVTEWDNYPEDVKNKEKIGGLDFNSEKVIGLNPDLVLAHASGMAKAEQGLEQLRQAGINVVVVPDATSFDQVYKSISLIGKVTGHAEKAEKVAKDMQDKITAIEEKAANISEEEKKTVWVEVAPAPEIYTTGKGTFMHETLQKIGAKNAAADQEGWVKFTEEDAVLLNPDVIVATYGFYVDNPVEQIKQRQAWQDVPAVKNDQIYAVDADKFNRAGPRLVEGVEELAKLVYPDVFK
ncbi:ABC transporter substrate-binding protein [Bacillus tianshenii]|nr:ABC transporter substrate-binding protein [Bacillus tianshenii]